MAKIRITNREVKDTFNRIVNCGCENISELMNGYSAKYYNCGVYGHNYDVWDLGDTCFIAGDRCSNIGKQADYTLLHEYNQKAKEIWYNFERSYEEKKADVDKLISEFLDLTFKKLEPDEELTVTDMKRICKEKGSHFFDSDTMRFFGSKIESSLYKNGVFITSEYTDFEKTKRGFTVRQFDRNTGDIKALSEFNQFKYKDSAKEFARTFKGLSD